MELLEFDKTPEPHRISGNLFGPPCFVAGLLDSRATVNEIRQAESREKEALDGVGNQHLVRLLRAMEISAQWRRRTNPNPGNIWIPSEI